MFQNWDGSPFLYGSLHRGLKRFVALLGLDQRRYGSHSLRAGGATTLAVLGFPPYLIQAMGRWKTLAYQLYISIPDSELRRASSAMGGVAGSHLFGGLHPDRASLVSLDNVASVQLSLSRGRASLRR